MWEHHHVGKAAAKQRDKTVQSHCDIIACRPSRVDVMYECCNFRKTILDDFIIQKAVNSPTDEMDTLNGENTSEMNRNTQWFQQTLVESFYESDVVFCLSSESCGESSVDRSASLSIRNTCYLSVSSRA